jgi:hypothetical protein
MNGNVCSSRGRKLLKRLAWLWLATFALATEVLGVEPTPAAAETKAPDVRPQTSTSPAASEPAIDPAAVAALVKQLDDDRYAAREAAQKQLAAAGKAALEAVAEAASIGSLECSTRCVNVLLSWADSKDSALSLAALERLASLENRPTEAASAYDRLAEVREDAAVQAIKALGGRFDYDRTFGGIGGMRPPVQVIIGPKWKGGVEGLRHIAAVRSATTLSLHSAPLDDVAVAELMQLSQVRRMEFYGTNVSKEAIGTIKAKLPQLMVDVRSGARLGIRGISCEQVLPDSPAHKAGLKAQDRIIEFAGHPLDQKANQNEQFEQLTKLISQCKPGDSKPIKVLRPNPQTGVAETVELTVTFDRWGDDERSTMSTPEGQDPFGPPQGMQRTIILQPGRIIQPGQQLFPNRR